MYFVQNDLTAVAMHMTVLGGTRSSNLSIREPTTYPLHYGAVDDLSLSKLPSEHCQVDTSKNFSNCQIGTF